MEQGCDDSGNSVLKDILPNFETQSCADRNRILSRFRFVDVLLVLCVFVGLVVAPSIAIAAVVVWVVYEFLH